MIKKCKHDRRRKDKIEKRCKICKKVFYVHNYRKNTAKFCSFKCYKEMGIAYGLGPISIIGKPSINKGKFGNQSHSWKGGKKYTTNGYVLIYAPNHPSACYNYFSEHRFVMEKHIGRYLRPEEIVHHINGIKDDNRIENLILFKNNEIHSRLHRLYLI